MIPNIYMLEQFTREHQQTLLREAEQKRRLAEAQNAPPPNSSNVLRQGLEGS